LYMESSQELEHLRRQLNIETENAKRQLKEAEIVLVQRYDMEIKNRQTQYELTLSKANNEIEGLRRRLDEVGGDSSRRLNEYEQRFSQLNQEYEKARSSINLLSQ
jgi:hypothetical protein